MLTLPRVPSTHAGSSLAETFTLSVRPTPLRASCVMPGEICALPTTRSTTSRAVPLAGISAPQIVPAPWPWVHVPRPCTYAEEIPAWGLDGAPVDVNAHASPPGSADEGLSGHFTAMLCEPSEIDARPARSAAPMAEVTASLRAPEITS